MEIRPVRAELFHEDGRTDIAKLTVAFHNFENTPNNSIHEEIKRNLNPGNACYCLVQNLLSSKNTKIKIYKTLILSVVLYGCDTRSLTLGEDHGRRIFEDRVLRKIVGPKRNEVTGDWRRLHSEEIYDAYSPPNIIRVIKSRIMRLAGHVARIGDRRGADRVLLRMLDGKRPLGRRRHRWDYNITIDLRKVESVGLDWIDLAQNRDR
jgi:hypothetical protein